MVRALRQCRNRRGSCSSVPSIITDSSAAAFNGSDVNPSASTTDTVSRGRFRIRSVSISIFFDKSIDKCIENTVAIAGCQLPLVLNACVTARSAALLC
jgi:hypothetical protein